MTTTESKYPPGQHRIAGVPVIGCPEIACNVWVWIGENPERYCQEWFRSHDGRHGTVGCLSSHIGMYLGWTWASDDMDDPKFEWMVSPDGKTMSQPATIAADALGLPFDLAMSELFAAHLTPDNIEEALARWLNTGTPAEPPRARHENLFNI